MFFLVKKITLQSQGMFRQLLKVPPAVFTLLSVVISAVIWAFLDPTLEPHLRQVRFIMCVNMYNIYVSLHIEA